LPDWFSIADVFVFPSRHDGWAVVINEACAAGLPIIVSTQTGAAHDLVEEGVNGFLLNCEEIDRWAERMAWCLEHRDRLASMGEASRRMVEPFSNVAGAARVAEFTHALLHPASNATRTTRSA
jgi:glycosyltransferase involved in cell wall biosynthesis